MNCHDFEQGWNDLIDARAAVPPALESALEAHAATCPTCRVLGARYQVLRQAIRSLGPLPSAPAGFAESCLAAWEGSGALSRRRHARAWSLLVPLAAAASLLVAVFLGVRSGWFAPRHVGDGPASLATAPQPHPAPLTDAVAEATSATWALALETSAPAARLGREVIDSAVTVEPPVEAPAAPESASASAVLQRVGDRLNEQVRPLSGTARHAFSFLLAPTS